MAEENKSEQKTSAAGDPRDKLEIVCVDDGSTLKSVNVTPAPMVRMRRATTPTTTAMARPTKTG